MSRKLFRSRAQEQGECFDDFLRNLRVLARDCKFTDFESELETALKEQVLMGVRSIWAQERILELPFKKTSLSLLSRVCETVGSLQSNYKDVSFLLSHSVHLMLLPRSFIVVFG